MTNNSKCPEGKILNPETGRCVKKDGKLGRKIIGERKVRFKEPERKECPEGKILNSETGRCVKKDGKLGRKIIGERNKTNTSSDYKILKKIGEGGFGKVYLIQNKITKKKYVMKVGKKKNMKYQYKMLQKLHDDNIINYLEPKEYKEIDTNTSTFIMNFLSDYIPLSDFIKKLKKKEIKLSNENYNKIYNSLYNDLVNIHNHQFVHTDIKSDNIMIEYSKNEDGTIIVRNVKFIDFGVTLYTPDPNKSYEFRGFTFRYLNKKKLFPELKEPKATSVFFRRYKNTILKENDWYAFQLVMDQLRNQLPKKPIII